MPEEIELGPLIMGLLGGLAIFLLGLQQMTDGLKAVAGAGLSKVLAGLTKNRFTAAITGAIVTGIIQSSSVTTVLVVGFISAGLMSLQQSIGIIMGANIGSTVTAQIIAFKVTKYALAIVAVGFAMSFFTKRPKARLYGSMIMGFGLIFLGMQLMSDATTALRTFEPFIEMMKRMDNPLLGILVAALFTGLVQSSAATTGIVIVLASQGFITLEAGIAMAFGANIGTCVTAALAAIGKPREAVQAAAVHLLFNIIGVLIWLPFIGALADVVQSISPAYVDLQGAERLAKETPRQIANAHTTFNVINTFIFIWFTGPIARLVTRLIPSRPEVVPELARPKYLEAIYLETPALALDRIRMEITRLAEQVRQLGEEARPAIGSGSAEDMDRVVERASENQQLYDAINDYIRRLQYGTLDVGEARRLAALSAIASHVQHSSETVAVNGIAIGRERLRLDVTFGDETIERVRALSQKVREAFDLSIQALDDPSLARRVIDMKKEVQQVAGEILEYLGQRLVADEPNRTLLYRLETQVVEIVQRQYYFAKKIAKEIGHKLQGTTEDTVLEDELPATAA
ncbi:MAG: NAD+ kinase [Phycisphaeraceae bacterium]|nr:NAD+ kinase [Phycisphaeraceae bacterium]